jgi:ubiquinone/menaquinone biosynthesis C-methylase UbiE
MSSPTAFWDGIADRYAARPVDDPAAYEATLARIRAHLSPTDHVLEVGCGTGTTALRLADAVAHYTATDLSPRMIEIAEGKRAAEEGTGNVTFRTAPLDAADGTDYEAVIASSLLHLVDDLPAALAALRDRLKPGGLLITKTICLAEMNPVLRLVVPVMRLFGKAPRVRFLRAEALEAAIRDAGFEIVETAYFPHKLRARFVVARRA